MSSIGLFRTASLLFFIGWGSATLAWEASDYEHSFTQKSADSYTEDTNTWVYTEQFAKRFRMPEKWTSEGLKGAYAVAFRVETYSAPIRIGHNQSASMPNRHCIIDVFVPSDAPLPWVNDQPIGINFFFPDAISYLRPKREVDWKPKRKPTGFTRTSVGLYGKNGNSGGLNVRYYDKERYPEFTYISFNMGCVTPPHSLSWIRFSRGKWGAENRSVVYQITLPETFMKRLYRNWHINSRKPDVKGYGRILEK